MNGTTTHQGDKTVYVRFLGTYEITWNGQSLTDGMNRSMKIWRVLAYFIVHRRRKITQAELIREFWQNESCNPVSALKTTLHRVRALMKETFGESFEAIESQRGSYSWNPELFCTVDAENFEQLCRRARELGDSESAAKITLYQQAFALYSGDFLPKLEDQDWVHALADHYRQIYRESVKDCCRLLQEGGEYERAVDVCRAAGEQDCMDEEIHILMIESLLRQGNHTRALLCCRKAEELLYGSRGLPPSEKLQHLLEKILASEKQLETDFAAIQREMKEQVPVRGAFFCDYGFFQYAYQLEVRRASRSGEEVALILVTVSGQDTVIPEGGILAETMENLKKTICENIRSGDVVSKYSAAQYIIMLTSADAEAGSMVMERVLAAYKKKYGEDPLIITYKVQGLKQY